ncbi:hypothetical protein LINGRAHAP2_LOCUS32670, partial [Linum grandiflorum]
HRFQGSICSWIHFTLSSILLDKHNNLSCKVLETTGSKSLIDMMNNHIPLLVMQLLFFFFTQPCHSSATILVDGVSPWINPRLFLGDSIIFKHKYGYNLYIFQSLRAFELCNFTHATLLIDPTTHSYSWRTSRTGFFYFAFSNGSSSCSQKLAIKVSLPPTIAFPPAAAPTPSLPEPISGGGGGGGGIVASSPAYPWPFKPREKRATVWAPAPEPIANRSEGGGVYGKDRSPMKVPKELAGKGGETAFINSNPAVALPKGEVDSATISPQSTFPTSGSHHQQMKRRKSSVGGDNSNMVSVCGVILLLCLWK